MPLLRLALTAALLFPTAPIPQQPPVPTIKINTKLTVVDVTVTDQYGHPVHGLKPEDFVIKEDGRPQPIRNFDEHGAAALTIPMTPKLPDGVYTNLTAADATPAEGPVNLLLFDRLGSLPDMYYARDQALAYLKTLPTGTRVAIIVLDNTARLLQDITTDRDVLIATVHSMDYQPVGGTTFVSVAELAKHCDQANEQSRTTIDAFRQIAASYAGVPGRKNLIWFTHGLPWLTNSSYFRSLYPGLARCLDDNALQLQAAYSLLSASQVAISTVDSRGLEAGSTNPSADFLIRQLNQESIRDFAEATGGTAYYNRNDLDAAIAESVASGADYYTIAYTPPLAGYDGKYHTISVKADRPGLQLSYRKGYTSLDLVRLNTTIEHDKNGKAGTPTQEAALPPAISQFRAQMSHGAASATELLLAASITPAAPGGPASLPVKGNLNPKIKPASLVRYDIVYALPPGTITLRENPDGTRNASVEFDVVAYGENGIPLNVLRQTTNLTLKPENVADFQQRSFKIPMQIDLPPGKVFVRVGALDVISGKTGTLEVPRTVARP